MTQPSQPSDDVSAEFDAALRLHAQGDLETAGQRYERLLRDSPEQARVVAQLGVLRMQQKRLVDALRLLDRAIALDANAPEFHAWRGEALRQQGAAQEAMAAFRRALELRPGMPSALFNLGLAQADAGNHADAERAWLAFLQQRPDDPRIRRELGRIAYESRRYAEAADWFLRQLVKFPHDTAAACDLATVRLAQNAHGAAREIVTRVLSAKPDDARSMRLLAQVLIAEGMPARALDMLERVVAADPRDVEATYQAGRACDALARLTDAIRWFTDAASLEPRRADIRNALAVAHLNSGEHSQAVAQFRAAVERRPSFREAHSNLLMALHYVEGIDGQTLFEEHVSWAKQHAYSPPMAVEAFVHDRSATRRIRVGYVSPRFCDGPLMRFFMPLLAAHDRDAFHITCYAVSSANDGATAMMREKADHWVNCADLDDDNLTALIRADRVDILVDLVGHCPGNRLGVFSRRAAPIQVTWMDYVDTTGLNSMDYILTDAGHTPVGGSQRFTEDVVRLPDTRLCYLPIDPLPDIAPLPALKRGHITFGCFNRLSKFGPGVIETWSEIMRRVPRSRLVLKSTAFAAESTRGDVASRFARRGVSSDRLDLRPFSSEQSMMREYADIDIALDPFPYNGCTTTCDALAMGVPVVTLEGQSLPGRHGVALLSACGMHDWVAGTRDRYIEIACAAAGDLAALDDLRRSLRSSFLHSPVCDGDGFASAVEAAYRSMWVGYCT